MDGAVQRCMGLRNAAGTRRARQQWPIKIGILVNFSAVKSDSYSQRLASKKRHGGHA